MMNINAGDVVGPHPGVHKFVDARVGQKFFVEATFIYKRHVVGALCIEVFDVFKGTLVNSCYYARLLLPDLTMAFVCLDQLVKL